ncbi:MAG: hypothetical protein AAF492_33035, partial [Verrucomicrobiota bacterium]
MLTPDPNTHTPPSGQSTAQNLMVLPGDIEKVEVQILGSPSSSVDLWFKIGHSSTAKIKRGSQFVDKLQSNGSNQDVSVYGFDTDTTTFDVYEGDPDGSDSVLCKSITVKVGGRISISYDQLPTFYTGSSVAPSPFTSPLPTPSPNPLNGPQPQNANQVLNLSTGDPDEIYEIDALADLLLSQEVIDSLNGEQPVRITVKVEDADELPKKNKDMYWVSRNNKLGSTIGQHFTLNQDGTFTLELNANGIRGSPADEVLIQEAIHFAIGESARLAQQGNFNFNNVGLNTDLSNYLANNQTTSYFLKDFKSDLTLINYSEMTLADPGNQPTIATSAGVY